MFNVTVNIPSQPPISLQLDHVPHPGEHISIADPTTGGATVYSVTLVTTYITNFAGILSQSAIYIDVQ